MTTPEEFPVGNRLAPEDRDPEAPPADAVEQATPANPTDEPVDVSVGWDVSEYDAVEQARVVDLDDEYR